MFYRVGFDCRDTEPFQRILNQVCDYGDDLSTKVLHRCRLNLFSMLMARLIERKRITSFEAALDIGCNTGVYARIISDFGFRSVLGIDVVESMIRKAEMNFGLASPGRTIEFRLQDAVRLDLTRRYDFILCTEVIEHTEQPDRVIANIHTLLAPGGVAVISMPNRLSLPYLTAWAAYRLRRKPRNLDFERHLEYPSCRAVRLFQGPELEVIATDGTNLFWDDRLIRALYPTAMFPGLNRVNFELARLWPLRYAAQFFYVVARKTAVAERVLRDLPAKAVTPLAEAEPDAAGAVARTLSPAEAGALGKRD